MAEVSYTPAGRAAPAPLSPLKSIDAASPPRIAKAFGVSGHRRNRPHRHRCPCDSPDPPTAKTDPSKLCPKHSSRPDSNRSHQENPRRGEIEMKSIAAFQMRRSRGGFSPSAKPEDPGCTCGSRYQGPPVVTSQSRHGEQGSEDYSHGKRSAKWRPMASTTRAHGLEQRCSEATPRRSVPTPERLLHPARRRRVQLCRIHDSRTQAIRRASSRPGYHTLPRDHLYLGRRAGLHHAANRLHDRAGSATSRSSPRLARAPFRPGRHIAIPRLNGARRLTG